MNNFEKIKQMNIDEMAEFFSKAYYGHCPDCPCYKQKYGYCNCNKFCCIKNLKSWLQSESEN